MTDIYYEQVLARLRELGQLGIGMAPVRLPLEPEPDEIEAINDDLRDIATKVDAVVRAYAEYIQHMTGHRIPEELYIDQLFKALDGNLIYEIEQAADQLREDLWMGVA